MNTTLKKLTAVLTIAFLNAYTFVPKISAESNETSNQQYGVTDYTVADNGDGTSTLNTINFRAKSSEYVKLYIADYSDNGRLKEASVIDVMNTNGNSVEPNLTFDNSDSVKIFLWEGMEPLAFPCEIEIPSSADETEIYVAANGNDETGDGTINNPYASFEKARTAVSKINKNMKNNITVYFRGGTYYVDNTIVLGPDDSGTNGYNVEYRAYPGETPVFSGGKNITGWTQDTENPDLYVAELNRNKRLRHLYVNDHRAYMPSKQITGQGGYGEYVINEGDGNYAWTDLTQSDGVKFNATDLPTDIKNPSDIELQTRSTWTTATVAVRGLETHDGYTVALLEQPYGAMAQNLMWGTNYNPGKTNYVYNVFEFMDSPGEFYFDRAEQKLYYWPYEDEDMTTAEVYAPYTDTLIRIEGENLSSHTSHIVIDGLTFANTDWNLHEIAGSHGKAATQTSLTLTSTYANWHDVLFRSVDITAAAIEITSADNIHFTNNTVKHTANDAISMINDVTDSIIDGNVIYDVGGTSLSVGHPQHHVIGDKNSTELTGYKNPSNRMSNKEKYETDTEGICNNLEISNNYMLHSGEMYYGCPGMTIYYGTNLNVLHNHIEDTPYSGISFGWCWGDMVGADLSDTNGSTDSTGETPNLQNNTIAYNRIINTLTKMSDGGGIYTLGPMRGTSIHDNYISKIGKNGYHSRGIHVDEGTRYMSAYNNVIEVDTDQAGIDCGSWGSASNTYHPKGYNTVYSNYTTTAMYKTTSSYETATTITEKRINLSGYWSEQTPISIIRNSGPEDEHLKKNITELANIILPSKYCLSAESGITEIDVPSVSEYEIWLAPKNTTEFIESDTIIKVKDGKLSVPVTEDIYYIYVIKDGIVSEPSTGFITTSYISSNVAEARTDVIGPYWADQDAENHVDNHQGSNGSVYTESFGTPLNVGETSAVFGILNQETDLQYKIINGVDSSGSGWIGYIEKNINIEQSGEYELYILCFGTAGRSYNVFVNDELQAQTDGIIGSNDSSNSNAYSSDNCLNILRETLQLNKGDNIIKLQGNGAGPNFVALALVRVEQEIPVNDMQLWLRADKGVTSDDNGYVTAWKDMSGTEHNAEADTETVPDSAPQYSADAANGNPALLFDGENDSLKFPFNNIISGNNDVTVIMVSAADKDEPSTNIYGDHEPLLYFDETSEGWGKLVITPFADKLSIRLPGEESIYTVDKNDDTGNGFTTTAIVKSGTSIQIYDRHSNSKYTLSNVPNILERINDEYGYIGGFSSDLGYFDGTLAELIIYDKAVDLGVIQSVNSYLNNKYYKETVEITGELDIFNGKQSDDGTAPGTAATNKYIKSVFGQGGWQPGNVYTVGTDTDYRAAFDSDITTYYDGPASGYCGVEFYYPHVITRIGFMARNGVSRLNNSVLQGSNDGITYKDIITIEDASDTEMRYLDIDCGEEFKYIRLKRSDNKVLNLYELKLYTETAE